MAYKFIVDGRWMTNDAEPTEVDHGFINNVYTAPAKPALPKPEPSTAPPSYHSESEAEHEPADKVTDKPATNGTALHAIRDTPTPTPDAPQQRVPDDESKVTQAVKAVRETVVPAAVPAAAQAAVAQVAPAPVEVEKAANEVRLHQPLAGSVLTTYSGNLDDVRVWSPQGCPCSPRGTFCAP